MGKKTLLLHSRMLHDPKTVIRSDFDQETAEKIAPPFIPRLELANCSDTVFVVTALKEISGLKALIVLFPWKRMPTVMSQESEKESESKGTI